MPTYLAKRGSTYQFRRTVPDHLQPIIGKTTFGWSLRTKDRKLANRLCHLDTVKTDAQLERAEAVAATLPKPDKAALLEARMAALAQEDDTTEVRRYAALIAASFRGELQKAADAGRLEARRVELEGELEKHELNLKDGSLKGRFSLSTSESMVLGLRAVLTGDGAANLPTVDLEALRSATPSPDRLMLFDLVELWSSRGGRPPTPKSVDMWKRTVGLFIEQNGDIPVSKITKRHVIALRDALVADGRKSATVQNRINQLRSLFKHAIGLDLIATDPSEGVKAPETDDDDKERNPWSGEALTALFNSPVYTSGLNMLGGGEAAAYFLPLLGLFTGARLNELGQLRPKDVYQAQYDDEFGTRKSTWVIRIVRDKADGLRLKNKSAIRRIPVHRELIRLGFIDLVNRAAERNQNRIFGDLAPDKYGTVTANWGKWFGRYIRKTCGVSDTRITYHSFRHSFKDICRALSIPEAVQDATTGHSDGRVARKYGFLDYPLAPMVSAMDKYVVFNLELPRPYAPRSVSLGGE